MLTNPRNEIFQYNGSPITFQKGDSVMVNATEMAKPFGKFTKDWLSNKSTKEFLSTLSAVRTIPLTGLVEIKQGGSGEQGTWMHEDVALEFARWLSPAFAIWCNDRIKELLLTGRASIPSRSDADRLIDYLKHELEQSKAELEQCKAELHYQRGRMDVEKELAAANAKLELQDELAKAKAWIMYQESEHRTEIRNGQLILHSKLKTEESGSGNAEQKPKAVKTYNAPCRFGSRGVIERKSPGAMLIREMCQKMREDGIAHVKSSEVFDWLRNNGHLSSAKENFNKPSDECLEKGWIVFSACGSTGSGVRYVTPYITKEGYKHFVGIIMQQGGMK